MIEQSVTFPSAALVYDPLKRAEVMLVVPGPGEIARFVPPQGSIVSILLNYDVRTYQEAKSFIRGFR